MDIQELISRGRFIFHGAPERLRVYMLVDGRKTAEQIAKTTRRHVNNVRRDLQKLLDIGLVEQKLGKDGERIVSGGFPVHHKVPLARTIPVSYFSGATKLVRAGGISSNARVRPINRKTKEKPLDAPGETEILDICRSGEDQIYEFKAAGTDVRKITREIAAMLNTRYGGIILYGVDDSGTIHGSDVKRQTLDQPLQNSIKNTIFPAATIALKTVTVVGHEVIVIIVPPWNRRDVYHHEDRVLIRKGTNVFSAKPEESKKLHRGEYVI